MTDLNRLALAAFDYAEAETEDIANQADAVAWLAHQLGIESDASAEEEESL